MTKSSAILLLSVPLLAACTPKLQPADVKKMLEEHPEILTGAIDKHPVEFAEAAQRAVEAHRRGREDKRAQGMKDKIKDSLQNPLKPEIEGRAFWGDPKAPVVVVAYLDMQSHLGEQSYKLLEALKSRYDDKVAVVVKHSPLVTSRLGVPAARRFEALAMQSPPKAYKYLESVVLHPRDLLARGDKFLDESARRAGGDMKRLAKDMAAKDIARRIHADGEEARRFGFVASPAYIVGGVPFRATDPREAMLQVVETRLKAK